MTERTWFRNSYGGIVDGRGWEIYRDSVAALKDDGREGLPWSLWHHGEYVENYATAEEAQADAEPMDCAKCSAPPAPVHRDLELRYVNGRFEVPCACGRVFRGDTPDDADALANRHVNGEDVPADVDDEPCPSCGARRADCIRGAKSSGGRVCCVHCAEAPLADTHRGPRP